MKKFLFISILFFAIQIVAFGQFSFPFGLTSMEDANLKECAFEPDAAAAILIDEGWSDFDSDSRLMTYQHTRIKVLKEEGKKYGEVSLTYRSDHDFENIDELEAMVINFDESGLRKEIPVDKKSIYRKKISQYRSEVSFAFPDVQVGSILEYRYRITAKHYGGLRDWNFQSDLPVYRSSFRLKIVPNREISYLVQYNPQYEVTAKANKNEHSIFFEMKNIPGMSDEPYMDARKDYLQKVIFQTTKYEEVYGSSSYMATWNEVTKDLYDRQDFGRQLKQRISECQTFLADSVADKPEYEKMKRIHNYVLRNVTWDGTYGVVADDGIKTLWKKKTGNAGEINLLLINLLLSADLEVYPMLVSERWNGKIHKTSPFIKQFNNVYAAVIINGKTYYLDATDKYTPCHLIPYSILNTTAFIANVKKGGLIDIEEPEVRYRDIVSIEGNLSEDGQLKGSASILSRDYARVERLNYYAENKKDYIDEHIKRGLGNITIDSFKIYDAEGDSLPLKHTFDFKTFVQTTGDYSFLSLNMFTGFESNPFIVNNRFSSINFGYKKSLNLNYIIKIPKNYQVDALPKNIKLINSSNTVMFFREIFQLPESSQIVARIKVDINKSLFGVDEYPEVKEFFKKMIDLMNEQIVFKKK